MKSFIKEKRSAYLLWGILPLLLFAAAVSISDDIQRAVAAVLEGSPIEVCTGSCFREGTVLCPDGSVVTSLGGAAEASYKLDRASSFCRKVGTSGLEGSPVQVCTGSCFQESAVACPDGYAVTGWGGALRSNAVFDRVSAFCRKVGTAGLEGSPVEVCTGSCFRESTVLCPDGYAVTGWGGAVSSGPKLDRASSFCRKVVSSPGTFIINATLNGSPWSGPITIDATHNGTLYPNVSVTTPYSSGSVLPTGTYVVTYKSGGPVGATLSGITPSATQTLSAGGTITFTFNFVTPPPAPSLTISRTRATTLVTPFRVGDFTTFFSNGPASLFAVEQPSYVYKQVGSFPAMVEGPWGTSLLVSEGACSPTTGACVVIGNWSAAQLACPAGVTGVQQMTEWFTIGSTISNKIQWHFECSNVPAVPTLVVTPSLASVQVGGTKLFKAIYDPADGTGPRTVTASSWSSSDIFGTSVATITSAGLATGNAVGSASIKATYAGLTSLPATLTVTAPVPALTIIPSTWWLTFGDTKQFIACFNPNGLPVSSDCSVPPDQNVTTLAATTWSSGDVSKVTIVPNGTNGGLAERVGFSPNSTVIHASYSGLSDSADVYDTARLHVSPSSKDLYFGDTAKDHVQLLACFNPNGPQISLDCSLSPDKNVTELSATTWKPTKPLVAAVDNVGYVTAQSVTAKSKASIRATYLNFSDNSHITVFPATAPPLDVSCSAIPASAVLNKDAVTWTAVPSGGTPPYKYFWFGSSPLGGKTGNPVTVTYSTAGTKTGSVRVTSGSQVVTQPCTTSVTVGTPPSPPLATLLVNGAITATIDKGQSATLTWTSTNGATRCDSPDFSTGGLPNNTSPGVQVSPLTDTTYTIYCTNAGGVGPIASVSVTVVSPKVSISASPTCINGGGNSKISWSATPASQMASCNVSGPGLSSSQISGSQTVNVTSKSTYTISCQTISGSTVTKQVIVDVAGCWTEF